MLPSVFGLTCARSRNSATPSSGLRMSCEYTSGSTTCSPIGAKPRRVKKSTSKVRQNRRESPSARALCFEALDDRAADAVVQPLVDDDQRADLAEVLPHHVQGAAADQPAVLVLGDEELLHRLVEHDEVLAEQDPALHERLEQVLDAAHVGRPRRAYRELTHPSSLAVRRHRSRRSWSTLAAHQPGTVLQWSSSAGHRVSAGSLRQSCHDEIRVVLPRHVDRDSRFRDRSGLSLGCQSGPP